MIRLTTLTMTVLLLSTQLLRAQPLPRPASPNFDRAYRYFANSPSSYKEISSPRPGYYEQTRTPYSFETYSVEPSVYRERITPYSFEQYEYVPGRSGTLELPYSSEGYSVPGYGRSFVRPLPPWRGPYPYPR